LPVVSFAARTNDDVLATELGVPESRLRLIAPKPARPTMHTRWQRFDAEFGIRSEQQSVVLASVRHVKYTMDLAVFSLKTFSDTIEEAVELRYRDGHIRRAASLDDDPPSRPRRADGPIVLEDARLKFDLELTRGRPYVGVRLVFPFGN
jgi:hypothetical protein